MQSQGSVQHTRLEIYFCVKILSCLRTTGFWILAKSIWRTFEADFGQTLQKFTQHTDLLKEHIRLANTVQVSSLVSGQELQLSMTIEALSNLKVSIFFVFKPSFLV